MFDDNLHLRSAEIWSFLVTAPGSITREKLPAASWRILALLTFSVFINYVDRGNLSIAAPLLKSELHLTPARLGILLSAFFWTYTLCQIPAGWLIDRFDVSWVLGIGFFFWSSATALTGILHGFAALFVIRLLLGIGEAVAYPSYSKILARIFPEQRRGIANAAIAMGTAAGPATAIFAGGLLMLRFGWRPFFIVLGLASLLWLLPWFRWRPRREPEAQIRSAQSSAALLQVCKERAAWGTCISLFCSNYFLYLLLTWLPSYLVQERHFALAATAKIGGVAFLFIALGALASGRLSDSWISKGASPTLVRKGILCFGLISGGTLFVISSMVSDTVSVGLLMAASAAMGICAPQNWAAGQALSGPRMAGTWAGLQNFIGNMAGIVAPALTGFLVERTGHFFWAFAITAAIGWLGTLSWLFLVGPIQEVEWDLPKRARAAAHG